MHVLLLIVAIGILAYNLVINITNLSKIIGFCFRQNSLNFYWEGYYKACVSGRAIYSTIISFILAFILFVIIAPILLIRGIIFSEQIRKRKESGLLFEYQEAFPKPNESTYFYTNIDDTGVENIKTHITGSIKKDCLDVIIKLQTFAKSNNIVMQYDVQQDIQLSNDTATIPLLLTKDNLSYPVYFIYTELHKKQFSSIRKILRANGIDQVIYFSAFPIQNQVNSEILQPAMTTA